MKIEGVSSLLVGGSAKPQAAFDAPHFSELLDPRDGGAGRLAQTSEQTVRHAAQQLVASTLVLPVLAQANKDPLKSDLFHGGQAEEMFQSQLDTQMADRITDRSRMPIVDSVYQSIMQQARRGRFSGQRSSPEPKLNIHG